MLYQVIIISPCIINIRQRSVTSSRRPPTLRYHDVQRPPAGFLQRGVNSIQDGVKKTPIPSEVFSRFCFISYSNVLELDIVSKILDVVLDPSVCFGLIGSDSLEVLVGKAQHDFNVGASESFECLYVWIIESHSSDVVLVVESYDISF
ncbi:hypothetical protein WN944_024208 [Citrus x changshan-huyou]|uniref:Uncharacterized protein n=1 Tax=Citrus x changshan-huyou TaxID=2935761 RepID=A0AAP0QB07_9ROSI